MTESLYHIRMRASLAGRHLSGAERLASEEDLESLAAALVRRALCHDRGKADKIHCTLEKVDPQQVQYGRLPELRTWQVTDYRQGRAAASDLLVEAGVAVDVVSRSIELLANGPGSGGQNMRGAMLVDFVTGARLEPDRERGIRVSGMDLTPTAERELLQGLTILNLNNDHIREALVLAAKVLAAPGVVAELCWSDDPDYLAGYVALPDLGYCRFPYLKQKGDLRGGRVFFVKSGEFELDHLILFLERQIFLVDRISALHPACAWKERR